MSQLPVAWSVDEKELLVPEVCRVVDGAVSVGGGEGADWEVAFGGDGGLRSVCLSGRCAALELDFLLVFYPGLLNREGTIVYKS